MAANGKTPREAVAVSIRSRQPAYVDSMTMKPIGGAAQPLLASAAGCKWPDGAVRDGRRLT
jgi:hypothetical protein